MLEDELRALVSVDPSPDFQARVKTRIHAAETSGWWVGLGSPWLGLRFAAVGVTVTLAAGLTTYSVLMRDGASHDASGEAVSASAAIAGVPVPLSTPVVARGSVQGATRPPVVPQARSQTRVYLDRAETLALQRLFAQAGALPPLEFSAPTGELIVIPEITIAPIVIDTISEGDRQ
jgi:hypothetical protein